MTLRKKITNYLNSIYYSPKHVAGFSSLGVMYNYIKHHGKFNISKSDVEEYLRKQELYTTHISKHKPKFWNKIVVPFERYMYDFDSGYLKSGDKTGFFVVGIDAFSRKMEARGVKDLKATTVSKAVEDIINTMGVPMKIRFDKGKEYANSIVNNMLAKKKIDVLYAYPPRKSQLAERVIRTIKSSLYKRMQHKGSKKWVHFLPDVVKVYNKRVHRSIGMAPNKVTSDTEEELWFKNKHEAFADQPPPTKYKFAVNDSVRLKLPKGLYSKDYDEKFSAQVYYIVSRHAPQNINRYKVKNAQNELLPQTYSENELVKVIVDRDTEYRIEKELRRKVINGIVHVSVKWFGYSSKFNSWIPVTDLRKLS